MKAVYYFRKSNVSAGFVLPDEKEAMDQFLSRESPKREHILSIPVEINHPRLQSNVVHAGQLLQNRDGRS